MSESANRNRTSGWRGWLVVSVSLGLLFGIAALKGRADSGGELD